ncbi:MAG TPA: HAD family acid phosphatase [Thermoanaerobaculia bacterium]|nr:HAD family acid phosphatase [Thermoanaerobaculia bacterium]
MRVDIMIRKLFVIAVLTSSCTLAPPPATTPCNPGLALVNAAAWVRTAAEYRASSMQTYAVAQRALDAALATPGDNPPAVILDLDETAIDNIEFEERMIEQGKTYDAAGWTQWVGESASGRTPGAAEFLAYARSRGVTPFYITNRKKEDEAATRRTLEKLGYPLSAETLLMKTDTSDKGPRRDRVASRYRVLLTFGDDLNDFVTAAGKSLEERAALVRANASKWGTSWFILPNPMYGSWEATIAGNGTPCEQLQRKTEALKP